MQLSRVDEQMEQLSFVEEGGLNLQSLCIGFWSGGDYLQ